METGKIDKIEKTVSKMETDMALLGQSMKTIADAIEDISDLRTGIKLLNQAALSEAVQMLAYKAEVKKDMDTLYTLQRELASAQEKNSIAAKIGQYILMVLVGVSASVAAKYWGQ